MPGPSFSIRPLGEAELPLVRALAHRIWPVCYGPILGEAAVANMLAKIYSLTHLRAEMDAGHRFWIAETDAPFAFASAFSEGDTVWIKKLYVDAGAGVRGAGRALMLAAIDAFMPVREARLLVNRDNVSAQEFYRHLGFAHVADVPVKMGDCDFLDRVFAKPL